MREAILSQIEAFLWKEEFERLPSTAKGIFRIINLISPYEDEGKLLYPEILITNNIQLFDTIPDYKIEVGVEPLEVDSYERILKLCAPLCTSEWVIYIEIQGRCLRYGLTCAEITETTPSLFDQTVGDLKLEIPGVTVAYIRNIGKKAVELKGLRSEVLVSLSLDDPEKIAINEIRTLAEYICHDVEMGLKELSIKYFTKMLSECLKDGGHGNLIGVIDDNPKSKKNLEESYPDGTYLSKPIDIVERLRHFEDEKSASNSTALRQHWNVVKGMVNHDGLSVFTTNGKFVGYRIISSKDFIPSEVRKSIIGAGRSKALYNMKYSEVFQFCFKKSQDGPFKTFLSR